MKSIRLLLLLAICFATLISSTTFAADYVAGQPVLVSGPSLIHPDCDAGPAIPGSVNYRNYEVEPDVAVNPQNPHNIVVSWQQDRWTRGGANGSASAVSRDGGLTWQQTLIPGLTRCSDGYYYRGGDDWLSFSKTGDLYHAELAFNATTLEGGVLINKSTNGGESWEGPITIASDVLPAVIDKESITVDPHDARYIYATYSKTEIGETSSKMTGWFTRTTDGGKTWEPEQKIADGPNIDVIGNQVLVLPKGDLIIAFTYMRSSLALVRSSDKGKTWGPIEVVSDLTIGNMRDPATGDMIASGSSIADFAVDPKSGAMYFTWIDTRFDKVTPAVALAKSSDGGRKWSTPVRIGTATAAAFTPSVAVAKDGTVGVSYFDVRNDTPDAAEWLADHWLATSRDAGTTWEETHIAGPFDVRAAPGRIYPNFTIRFLGDYVGLATSGKSFVAAYALPTGDVSNPTDIYVSVMSKKKVADEEDGDD